MKLVWVKERGRSSFGLPGVLSLVLVLVFHEAHLHSVPTGRVIFEIGGTPIREELAREGRNSYPPLFYIQTHSFIALRQAADKLPTIMEFITRSTPPRLGNLVLQPDPSTDQLPSPTQTIET